MLAEVGVGGDDEGGGSRYAQATAALRSSVRLLLASLGATAAVLLAGVQLTRLGDLGWDQPLRLVGACACVAVALGAVLWMSLRAAAVFTDEWVTVTDLGRERLAEELEGTSRRARGGRLDVLLALEREVDRAAPELFGDVALDVAGLHRRLRVSNERVREVVARERPPSEEDLAWLAVGDRVRAAAVAAADCANYHRTAGAVRRLRPVVVAGGAVTAAAVIAFALLTA